MHVGTLGIQGSGGPPEQSGGLTLHAGVIKTGGVCLGGVEGQMRHERGRTAAEDLEALGTLHHPKEAGFLGGFGSPTDPTGWVN